MQWIGLLISFGKIGLLSLGGGNSMLKLIEFEAVNARQWLLPEEFAQMIGTTFLFPGLTAVKLAGLIGYKTAGIVGSMLAALAINVPGLILTLIGYALLKTNTSSGMKQLMLIVQYGALALLAAATYSVAQSVIITQTSWPLIIGTCLLGIGLIYFQWSPFWGLLGFIVISYTLIR